MSNDMTILPTKAIMSLPSRFDTFFPHRLTVRPIIHCLTKHQHRLMRPRMTPRTFAQHLFLQLATAATVRAGGVRQGCRYCRAPAMGTLPTPVGCGFLLPTIDTVGAEARTPR